MEKQDGAAGGVDGAGPNRKPWGSPTCGPTGNETMDRWEEYISVKFVKRRHDMFTSGCHANAQCVFFFLFFFTMNTAQSLQNVKGTVFDRF